jgi:integrase
MLFNDLCKNDKVTNWLIEVSEDEGTRRLYTYHLQYYTEFLHMTPEEIINEAESEIVARVKTRESKLNRHLTLYKEHMRKNFAPKTVKSRMTAVRSFYQYHDIPLPPKIKKEKRAKPLKENQEEPTKEDLQEVLRHCDELERCIVLLGASAGLGAQEISRLTVRDFERGYDEKTQVTMLRLRREKVDYDFITFLNPEATRAVLEYLEIRKRDTKSHNKYRTAQLEKQRLTKNSYLLIRRKVPNVYLKTRDEELRRLTEDAIGEIYNLLSEKSGKSTPKGQWGLIRSHNIRKYFSNTLLQDGVEKKTIDFWMGHTQDDSDTAYFHSIAKTGLRNEYMKHMACLYLAEGVDLENDPMVIDLKEKNAGFKRVVEDTAYEMKTTRSKLEITEQKIEANEQKLKESEEKLKQAQQEAHNEFMALQADRDLENKVRDHDIEQMQKQIFELKQMLLSRELDSIEKNMTDKRKPKLTKKEEKEMEDMATEFWNS